MSELNLNGSNYHTEPNELTFTSDYTIKVIPDDGYRFKSQPVITYLNENFSMKTLRDSAWTKNLATFTIPYNPNYTAYTVRATTEVDPDYKPSQPIAIVITLNNCTIDPNLTSIEEDTTFIITPNVGYILTTSNCSLNYFDGDSLTYKTIRATINSDGTGTIVAPYNSNNANYRLTANATEDPNFRQLKQLAFAGNDFTYEPNITEFNNDLNLTLIPNEGYKFSDSLPTCTYQDADLTIRAITSTLNDDGTATLNIIHNNDYDNYTIRGSAILAPVVKTITFSGNNFTYFPNVTEITESTDFIFKPDSGYEFHSDNLPIVTYQDGDLVIRTIKSTLLENGNAKITVPYDLNYELYTIRGSAFVKTEYHNKYGFLDVYIPSSDQLTEILKNRYRTETMPSGNLHYIDLGDYIATFLKVFIDVPATNEQNVNMGPYELNVMAPVADSDIVTISCGNVIINEEFNNVIDYENTEVRIYLPFIGFNTLDIKKYMGKTINLDYIVNIINGDCIAKLYDINSTIDIFNGNCSILVPYGSKDDNTIKINDNYLGGLTPFINIYRPLENECASIFGYENYKTDVLENFSGYCEFENVVIEEIATLKECEEIKSILKEGIVI